MKNAIHVDLCDVRIAGNVIAAGLVHCADDESGWSERAEVCFVCPSAHDAMTCPQQTAAMAQAVIDTYGECSDRAAWADLIDQMRAAGEAVENIDAADLRRQS